MSPFQRVLAFRSYILRLGRTFGWRFLLFLVASQLFLKGLANSLSLSLMFPLLKMHFHVDAYRLQLYSVVVMIAWSIKPLIGLLSDLLLFCGYHKRFWLFNALLIGTLGGSLLFVQLSAAWIAVCLACIHYQIAVFDLMSEGAYSAKMAAHPSTGSDLVTFTQALQHAGSLLAISFSGPLADAQLFYVLFSLLLGTTLLVPLFPTLFGWIDEGDAFPHGTPLGNPTCYSRLGIHQGHPPIENRGMVLVIALTGIAAPLTAAISTLASPVYGVSMALLFTCASLLGAHHVFPPLVFQFALYQVLILVGAPSIGSALDYWYTASDACVPGGPQFSFAYYQTYAGLVGRACSFLGAALYQLFLSKMSFRRVFILTSILKGLVGFSDLFIVRRWNIALGIPDRAAYIVGEAVMEPVIQTLNYIPGMALLSRVCVHGMESSTFAYLAGTYNFASMLSEMGGALLFRAAGIQTAPDSQCNFDALWILVLLCHFVLPLTVGTLFSWLLIPDSQQAVEETAAEVVERELDDFSPFSDDDDLLVGGSFSSADGEDEIL